jgi:hypothetical protein
MPTSRKELPPPQADFVKLQFDPNLGAPMKQPSVRHLNGLVIGEWES